MTAQELIDRSIGANEIATPTIAQIAAHNESAGGHYFDRATMRFFGQRRSDFRVRTLKDGRIVVFAYSNRGWLFSTGKPTSLAVYDPKTGDVETPSDSEILKETLRKKV